jgi:formylglycine-generating enzyme required for sulfatase activity
LNRLIEIFDNDKGHKLDETSLPLLIGMDDTAHIRLHGEGGIVAYVGESRNHLFLQPADGTSARAIYHNDESVTGSVWLKSGDTTRIGESLVRWHLSGQRVEIHISIASARVLRPPLEPPDRPQEKPAENRGDEDILPVVEVAGPHRSRFRNAAIIVFALLLTGAAFVLLANPLAVTVTPTPDSLSVSGFPPPVKFGDSYLGISGRYTLHAVKAGYRPLEEEVQISGSNSHYSFTLEKLPGLIDLLSAPDGATVMIDGMAVGETPMQDVEISAGRRIVRFEHERYLPIEQTVEVEGFRNKLSLQVELEPNWAVVTLQTEPAGATLLVDGKEQGLTPLTVELIAGQRHLLFTKKDFTPLDVGLTIEAGQELELAVYQLAPSPAMLILSSVPTGATVTVKGAYKGLTPLSINLPSGSEHELSLTLPGHLPANRKLRLGPGENRELSVNLEPQYGVVFITATPAEATLTIDGKKQEQTTGRFQLTTRPHTIELKASGYESVTREVTPQSGYSQRIEIDLHRKQTAAQAEAQATSVAEPVKTTALGQKLVLITPKPFLAGASRKEAGRRANESEHEIIMQRHFYLAAHEVTNSEYKRFQAQHSSGMAGNRSLEIDSHPVANVTWEDATRFLNWLSKQDGLPPFYREENGSMVVANVSGTGYRLPTEAEWAFAARMAGQKERVRYPWSGKYPPTGKAGNFADESARQLLPVVIEGYNDGFLASAPIGSFPANPAGIHDLGGNVAEWCHDYYAANPTGGGQAEVDPTGPASGTHHVVRGSSWRNASITELRYSYRRYSREPASDIGFRIARYAQ